MIMKEEPIEVIIQRYTPVVYGIAMTKLQNRFDADDVFQDVFLIYHRKKKKFNEEEHRKAWLIRTTLNCCKKVHASLWRKRMIPSEKVPDSESFQFQLPEENDVYLAMEQLPEKYRLILHLYYFESYSADEISALLRIRPTTIYTQLSRGRKLMEAQLKGVYTNET